MIITTTVTKILGAEDWASFCHSAIIESLLMIPILYLGMTVPIAFWECTAWSKETVALRPAFWARTMGPPGCSVWYLVTSYTLSWMTIQRSSSVLCLATSSQSITFYDVIFCNILIFIIDLVILLSTNRTTLMIVLRFVNHTIEILSFWPSLWLSSVRNAVVFFHLNWLGVAQWFLPVSFDDFAQLSEFVASHWPLIPMLDSLWNQAIKHPLLSVGS